MQKRELMKLPTGRVFSLRELNDAVQFMNVKVPVEKLVEYGESCNWLTRKGKSFSSVVVFVAAYNSVYLQEELGERL